MDPDNPPYATHTALWRASDGAFDDWRRDGVALAHDGALQLDQEAAHTGTDPYGQGGYNGHDFYNGGGFVVGEAVSPPFHVSFGFTQAIESWNAATPEGTWLEAQLRAQIGERWTKWYSMGVWASDTSTVEAHSVDGQRDQDGTVSTDTLVLDRAVTAAQLKVQLFSASKTAVPVLRNAALSVSTTPVAPVDLKEGDPACWGRVLEVPEHSQMVYPDGGNVWCSPTSLSMALSYWGKGTGSREECVRGAVGGVYDWLYDGHGNWPFNTAHMATHGLEAYVARLGSLAEAEPWVAAGVPVIMSYAWDEGELTGAAVSSSNGHLGVLCGFDASGNPVVNDPAARDNETVRRTYIRAELESLWLEHSGGVVYLAYPPGWVVPSS